MLSKNLIKVTILIQKSDKSSVVIFSETEYSDKIENLLNDISKFEKINLINDVFCICCQPRKVV